MAFSTAFSALRSTTANPVPYRAPQLSVGPLGLQEINHQCDEMDVDQEQDTARLSAVDEVEDEDDDDDAMSGSSACSTHVVRRAVGVSGTAVVSSSPGVLTPQDNHTLEPLR